jgi:TfoX/Sxy family transcriptional regulator of competence genes
MAYDEVLADRVRAALALRAGLTERKMFGGLAFMVGGNMACGVIGDELMVRLDYEDADRALAEPHVRPMDFTGKPLRGMVYVGPEAIRSDDELASWVEMGADRAASLPPK